MTEKESREALFKLNYEYMKHTKEERKKLYESYSEARKNIRKALIELKAKKVAMHG